MDSPLDESHHVFKVEASEGLQGAKKWDELDHVVQVMHIQGHVHFPIDCLVILDRFLEFYFAFLVYFDQYSRFFDEI